jgi:hypothetical protein
VGADKIGPSPDALAREAAGENAGDHGVG